MIRGPQSLEPITTIDMTSMPDAALTLIAMAPLMPGDTTITGLSTLHHKECDRLVCSAQELMELGVDVVFDEDSITIPWAEPEQLKAHTLSTYHDHRMAMAFSLIGSLTGTLSVDDERVVDKTYPTYWQDYALALDPVA